MEIYLDSSIDLTSNRMYGKKSFTFFEDDFATQIHFRRLIKDSDKISKRIDTKRAITKDDIRNLILTGSSDRLVTALDLNSSECVICGREIIKGFNDSSERAFCVRCKGRKRYNIFYHSINKRYMKGPYFLSAVGDLIQREY